MERYFSLEMPATRFVLNTLIASLLGLALLLFLYVALTPGFASHLARSGPAFGQFMRQVLTNGLPVVFLVNYAGFMLFAWTVAQLRDNRATLTFILIFDPFLRVLLFIALHAFIYVLSVDWFASFGGNRITALKVLAPTLARSALFENISGVYLYATVVSALPLYVVVLSALNQRFRTRLLTTDKMVNCDATPFRQREPKSSRWSKRCTS